MISLRSNIMVDKALRNLNLNMDLYSKSILRLSSGLRITSAADDPAGSVMASQFERQIASLRQKSRNTETEISSLQTKEGALGSMQDTLQRMNSLAAQASTGTYSTAQRSIMNNEFEQLKEEYAQIANGTKFNGNQLMSEIELDPGKAAEKGLTNPFEGVSLSDVTSAKQASASINNMIEIKSAERSSVGTAMYIAESKIEQYDLQAENLSEARSRITDVDFAQEMVNLTTSQVAVQAGISVIKTANEMSKIALKLLP